MQSKHAEPVVQSNFLLSCTVMADQTKRNMFKVATTTYAVRMRYVRYGFYC